MLKIRLSRGGVKKKPFYKIVAIEEGKKREGKPLDVLGHWHPAKKAVKIDEKKVKYWVSRGAQITKAVSKLLKSNQSYEKTS